MKYPLTFYVKSLPANTAGTAFGPIIRILDSHRADYGIYKHELMHVIQWFVVTVLFALAIYGLSVYNYIEPGYILFSPLVFGLLYTYIPQVKLYCEVQAYKEQLKHYPDDRTDLFAGFIADYYGLKVTKDQAKALLNK